MIYDISGHDLYKGLIYTFLKHENIWLFAAVYITLSHVHQNPEIDSLIKSQTTKLEDRGSIIMKLYTRLWCQQKLIAVLSFKKVAHADIHIA